MQQLIIFCLIILAINADLVKEGKCPDLKSVQNFDKTKIEGWWYTIESYSSIYNAKIKCEKLELKIIDSQHLSGSLYGIDRQTGKPSFLNTTLEIIKPNIGEFGSTLCFEEECKKLIVKVLGTDYKHYSIFYVCMQHGINYYTTLWISSRERQLPPELLQNVRNILDKDYLETAYLHTINQNNCDNVAVLFN